MTTPEKPLPWRREVASRTARGVEKSWSAATRIRSGMFEHKSQPLLPRRVFVRRQVAHLAVAIGVIAFSTIIGAVGYHVFEGFGWLDSIYAASMILTGMGPITPLRHDSTKVFVSVYAVFSSVVFLTTAGIVLSPLVHRLMHHLHWEDHGGRGARRN